MYNDKPVIGVTMGLSMEDHNPQIKPAYRFEFLKQQYYEVLENQDGIILPIPNTPSLINSDYYISLLDGLLLVGGEDIDPKLYGLEKSDLTGDVFPRRDNLEREMLFKAVSLKIPVMGICRGHQMVNVAFGGSLYEDLDEREEKTLNHRQTPECDFSNTHKVKLENGSRLRKIVDSEQIVVNSAHHQIIRRVAKGLKPAAYSSDGVVEALESEDNQYLLTVQWHPEASLENDTSELIFEDFVNACRIYRAKR